MFYFLFLRQFFPLSTDKSSTKEFGIWIWNRSSTSNFVISYFQREQKKIGGEIRRMHAVRPFQRLFVLLLVSYQCWSLKVNKPISTNLRLKPKTVTPPKNEIFNEVSDPDVELPKIIVATNKLAIGIVKDILGVIYGDRHYARFAALETIARVPYFSCK